MAAMIQIMPYYSDTRHHTSVIFRSKPMFLGMRKTMKAIKNWFDESAILKFNMAATDCNTLNISYYSAIRHHRREILESKPMFSGMRKTMVIIEYWSNVSAILKFTMVPLSTAMNVNNLTLLSYRHITLIWFWSLNPCFGVQDILWKSSDIDPGSQPSWNLICSWLNEIKSWLFHITRLSDVTWVFLVLYLWYLFEYQECNGQITYRSVKLAMLKSLMHHLQLFLQPYHKSSLPRARLSRLQSSHKQDSWSYTPPT